MWKEKGMAVLSCLVLVAALFSGCGEDTAQKQQPTPLTQDEKDLINAAKSLPKKDQAGQQAQASQPASQSPSPAVDDDAIIKIRNASFEPGYQHQGYYCYIDKNLQNTFIDENGYVHALVGVDNAINENQLDVMKVVFDIKNSRDKVVAAYFVNRKTGNAKYVDGEGHYGEWVDLPRDKGMYNNLYYYAQHYQEIPNVGTRRK